MLIGRRTAVFGVTVAFGVLALSACSTAPPRDASSLAPDARPDAQEIESVCWAQQAAWNRGDVEGFVRAGYWPSESLTFFSGGEVTRGYETVLARYKRRYQSEGAEMGQLTFSNLETEMLGTDHAILRGNWLLDFEKRDDAGGLFTLVLRRTQGGWRIVHDHTSVGG
jgi:beta-aspartyl-peptidase (threonine type)